MRCVRLAAFLFALSAPLQAQADTNVLAISRPGMANVVVTRGLTYTPNLTLDVYRPSAQGGRRPALIFVHGGLVANQPSPLPTTWPSYQSWGRLAAASGWVGVMFNHRLTTADNVVDAESEVRAAIKYVRDNAATLGVDADRLCIAFYSAGGQIAAAALHDPQPYIRCVVLFYPFLDLEHQRNRTAFREAHPAARVDSLVSRYSPAAVIAREASRLPPLYVAMAGQDAIPGLNDSIRRFMQVAMTNRVPLDFALHPAGAHGFDQRNHDERSREILENVMSFIGRHLAAPPRR
jgi:acetyl esterase/lipase